jgi:hypothetical protein
MKGDRKMLDFDRPYTMGFKDALRYGLDYRDYEKVSTLPNGVPLMAIAGVWGDYSNIRCLFMTEDGKGYLRNINGHRGKYIIHELGVNAKEIAVGTVFVVEM